MGNCCKANCCRSINVCHITKQTNSKETFRPCFHEVTVVRKIVTQSESNFFSLPSLRENSDDLNDMQTALSRSYSDLVDGGVNRNSCVL